VQLRGRAQTTEGGHLLVFDAAGRTVRHLRASADGGDSMSGEWDGRDGQGNRVAPGVYFVRWSRGAERAAGRVVVLD
jgi:hypothetical protein